MKTYNIIQSYYPTLTKSEKKIADFILSDVEKNITQMSTSEFARSLGLGEASVIRFCKKIGFAGYLDLKFALAVDYSTSKNENASDLFVDEIADDICDAVRGTRELLDMETVRRAVEMITGARRIYIYGAGSSGIMARLAEERLMRTGIISKSVSEWHLQAAQSAICAKGDIIIAFSSSGATADLNKAVKIGVENGARVIAITNHIASPLAALADLVLATCGKENIIEGGNFATMASMVYVFAAICAACVQVDSERVIRTQERIARAVRGGIDPAEL